MVKETQSLTKVRGVVPVMSSHWAGDVPPTGSEPLKKTASHRLVPAPGDGEATPTCDAAEKAETRSAVSFITVGKPLP